MTGTVLRRLREDTVPLVLDFDEGRFQGVLDGWVAATGKGLVDGGLTFEGTQIVEIAPKSGVGIQRNVARDKVISALEHGSSDAGTLTIGATTPAIDAHDVARAARRARAILAAPVTVTVGTTPLTLTPEQVAPTLETAITDSQLVLNANPDKLRAAYGAQLGAVETAPQDANFAINGNAVCVVPAVTGQLVDLTAVGQQIAKGNHAFTAPLRSVEPAKSTEWAQKLNITELVASYTTNHPCCAARVTNIHKAADTINNTIIEPGQTFSLNDALGERTLAKGYATAPQIGADLAYEDSVGGGVSQLSTTLYNAIFFGCYQDVTHTVHALYISRYPLGREATLNYPSIDNKFRNDSGSGILIKTFYSGTSVTVALFGNKEGRTCRAEGPHILSTEPPGVKYVDDPAVPVGTQKVIDSGHTGYVVENFRIIDKPGQPEKRERYVEHYSMTPQTIERGTGAAPPPRTCARRTLRRSGTGTTRGRARRRLAADDRGVAVSAG